MDIYNTDEIRSRKNELRQQLENFKSECKACNTLINELNPVWNDAAYDAFVKKYQEYKPTMNKMQECLQEYINFMDSSAKNVDDFVQQAVSAIH